MGIERGDSSIQRIVARPSGTKLLAAGAFDPDPTEIDCGWVKSAAFLVDYAEGGAGGAPQMIIEVSDGVNWFRWSFADDDTPAVIAGTGDATGTAIFVDQELFRFRPRAAFSTMVKVMLDKNFYKIRVNFAEYPPGTLATPGVAGCVVLLSGD